MLAADHLYALAADNILQNTDNLPDALNVVLSRRERAAGKQSSHEDDGKDQEDS